MTETRRRHGIPLAAAMVAASLFAVAMLAVAALVFPGGGPAKGDTGGESGIVSLIADEAARLAELGAAEAGEPGTADVDRASSGDAAGADGDDADGAAPVDVAEKALPRGWVVSDVPEGELASVGVEYLPGVVGEGDSPSAVVVSPDGARSEVPPGSVLVNLPDVLAHARFDAVYSYAATSRCAGEEIPGLTGCRVDGYPDGRQRDVFLDRDEFAMPAAASTARKLLAVERRLEQDGYALLIYDVYRPMRASHAISGLFSDAFSENPVMQGSLGEWSLGWYAADGVSGHNFGADVDTGVCALDGSPIAMPSEFDAFDEGGHLVSSPMRWQDISPGDYTEAVKGNPACMSLHAAMCAEGFSELASEWWHFGDGEGQAEVAAVVGSGGLDFTPVL